MYILKNALKCISRSKGRNILIGVIVLVIAISSCIGLSIREAAEKTKEDVLEGLSVTATISFDRSSVMSQIQNGSNPAEGGVFDKEQFAEIMKNAETLSLAEYEKYAQAESVKDFYYTETISVNGSEDFSPVITSDSNEGEGFSGAKFSMPGGFSSDDFSIVGYSCEAAMTAFQNGTATITQGAIFEEGTEKLECIISEELATYNDLSVGDTVAVENPNNSTEIYTLAIVGFFSDSSANEMAFGGRGGMAGNDPANTIYMSSNAVDKITLSSSEANQSGDEQSENALTTSVSGTYVFADTDSYYKFEDEARELGLDSSYVINSFDLASFESRLTPLNTLSNIAGWFLVVILCIGAIILIVLNIFNVRERKYEIGVLTAMGMSKVKVAFQFLTEIFAVTLISVIIGASVGAISSVPVTNALLQNQIEAQEEQSLQLEQNFGRGDKMFSGDSQGIKNPPSGTNDYISEISSATNATVIIEMLGIAILLTLVSGAVSIMFIMRYEPLKILANRD